MTTFKPNVSLDAINTFKNCMNVCPRPQELYSKPEAYKDDYTFYVLIWAYLACSSTLAHVWGYGIVVLYLFVCLCVCYHVRVLHTLFIH